METPTIEARYYHQPEHGAVVCELCPQACRIAEGKTGKCRTRLHRDGKLYLLNYGRFTSLSMDPVEKKPLYHFFPGHRILSIGGLGCNLNCVFCQNWTISQGDARTRSITPEQLAAEAAAGGPSNIGVAFTYNEPLIWFEFILDCARLLRAQGHKVVLVTNGYINPGPFAELASLVDAMNIDLKSSDDSFYKKHCGGRVEPVKETIRAAVAAGIWVEVTQLLITGLNDNAGQVRATASWLGGISKDIPLHLSRYFPNYQLDVPPTPPAGLTRAYDIASEHLNYVYLGNIGMARYGRTICPACGAGVIERDGYDITTTRLAQGMTCAHCGARIAGRGKEGLSAED